MREQPAVRRTQSFRYLPIHQLILLVALLAATSALGQRTVVQDAGGGRKLELHYNAEGKVAELRTIGPDGQLLQQQTLEYPAGSYVPNTTATSYWPNGKVHKITRNTYDNNANFTGEFAQVFDESGKQTVRASAGSRSAEQLLSLRRLERSQAGLPACPVSGR